MSDKKVTESEDLKYLIDCEVSEAVDPKSTTDSIRSKLFWLDSRKGSFGSTEAFNDLKFKLMTRLNEAFDRPNGKNTCLSEAMVWSSRSSQRTHNPAFTRFESQLFRLSEQQLIDKLNLKSKMRGTAGKGGSGDSDCKVIAVVLNTKTKKEPKNVKTDEEDSGLGTSGDNNIVSQELDDYCDETKTKSVLNKIGSYRTGFVKRTNSSSDEPNPQTASKRTIGSILSPTRVPGIFKTNNSPKVCNKNVEKTGNWNPGETSPKRLFITAFEKNLSDGVKNKSIDLKKAQNMVKQMKNPFKNPKNPIKSTNSNEMEASEVDPNLKNIDPNMIETIENEIISNIEPIEWSDVAGLTFAKKKIHEIAVLPLLRPDLFSGIRKPPKGILLFGPPGTGKTFLGRCIASQTKSTFFSITVSALNSKWIGEGEKMIRALFAVARARQPSVIFIDEIDSLLKNRSDSEHESSRRMKTEFLAQFEGVTTNSTERLLIIGATNRPQELDDAARRRLSVKLYIRLPDMTGRKQIIEKNMKSEKHTLSTEQMDELAQRTDGYSCADMRDLCRESAMEAIREIEVIDEINETQLRGISYDDFCKNLEVIKPTVRLEDLKQFEDWNQMFGQKNV